MKTMLYNRTNNAKAAWMAMTLMSVAAISFANDEAKSPPRTQDQASTTGAEATKVRVTRASNYLGADVTSSDGRKVGDIVDFCFDTSGAPHLAYVFVMTGGFLDMGGDVRAIPAEAITSQGDGAKIQLASAEYWDVPVLPQDRHRYLSDSNNAQTLAQHFKLNKAGQTAANSGSQAGANAPTGRTGSERQLVAFSELRNADAYSSDDNRLGFLVDAWINLDHNRAPYVEVTGTYQPFRTNYDTRYAIPTAKLEGKNGMAGYKLEITQQEMTQAKPVSETDGVKMLQNNQFEDTVLRVTVAQR